MESTLRVTRPIALVLAGTWAALAGCNRPRDLGQHPVATRPAPLIVGTDDRSELYEAGLHDADAMRMHVGRSAPALIGSGRLTQSGSTWTLETFTGLKMCPDVRYSGQRLGADCSAALVGDDLILTAYHCVNDPTMGGDLIPHRKVVFGFHVDPPATQTQGRTTFNNDQVYRPTAIVHGVYAGGQDWALVRLDRAVHPRYMRLKISATEPVYSTNPAVATQAYSVGYGFGLPAKISREGYTVLDTHPSFRTVIEGFNGNSGSPIINRQTHEIIGVLNSGPDDVVWNAAEQCYRLYTCPGTTCNMVAQKASLFRHLVNAPAPSCSGVCNGTPDDGGCWCDDSCAQYGDCCADKTQVCGASAPACANACGGQAPSGCWCDLICASQGDCCPGYFETCGRVQP